MYVMEAYLMHLIQGSTFFLRSVLSLHQRVGALCSVDVGAQSVYVIWGCELTGCSMVQIWMIIAGGSDPGVSAHSGIAWEPWTGT